MSRGAKPQRQEKRKLPRGKPAAKERAGASEQLVRQSLIQATLREMLELSLQPLSLEELLDRALGIITGQSALGFHPMGAIWLAEGDAPTLTLKARRDRPPDATQHCARVRLGECFCGEAAVSQQIRFGSSEDGRQCQRDIQTGVYSRYAVPIVSERKTLGLMTVYLQAGRAPDPRDRELLQPAADLLAGIIKHTRLALALNESEERYRRLVDVSPDAILVIADERLEFANEAGVRLLGAREPGEILGREAAEFIAADRMALMRGQRAEAGGAAVLIRERARRLDGREVEIEAASMPIALDGRDAFLVVARDVTEREQVRQQVFRAEKLAALGQLIAGVAHEINNPNNFIVFNLPLLREYLTEIEPALDEHAAAHPHFRPMGLPYATARQRVRGVLEVMEHGSQRITAIVGLLKDYVRSHEPDDKRPGDLGAVVAQAMALVGKQIQKSVSRVESAVALDLPRVLMDEKRLEQVLINLLINASHAADKPDSWIRVAARRAPGAPGCVELEVADNGAGIPEEIQTRVFDPFFTTKGPEIGTGLGLAISQSIVEDHRGRILLESEPGRGAKFTIRLPAHEEGPPCSSPS